MMIPSQADHVEARELPVAETGPVEPEGRSVRVLNLLSKLSRGGGIPTVVRELIVRSDPRSVEHHVCQLRPIQSGDLDEKLLQRARFSSLEIESDRPPGAPATFARANLRFTRIVRRARPDVVHVHTGTSLNALAARLSSGRRAAWLMDFHEPLEMRHSVRTTRTVYTMVRRLGFVGVTHSSAVTRRVNEALGGSVPLVRIPLGVETSRFSAPVEERRAWRVRNGLDPESPLVVSVGRLAPLKGARELVEVARRVLERRPAVQFALCSGGPLREELTTLTHSYGIADRVRFLGFIEDLPSALAAADLFLTTTRYEGFGIAVLEAMASGLPVVGTRIDGLEDLVVDGKTGFLVSMDDLEGYAASVVTLTDNASRRAAFAANARRRAEDEFDISVTVRAYERLYRELATRSRTRGKTR